MRVATTNPEQSASRIQLFASRQVFNDLLLLPARMMRPFSQ
jgi:hypothetical protein